LSLNLFRPLCPTPLLSTNKRRWTPLLLAITETEPKVTLNFSTWSIDVDSLKCESEPASSMVFAAYSATCPS
jgi:hypothetical protein